MIGVYVLIIIILLFNIYCKNQINKYYLIDIIQSNSKDNLKLDKIVINVKPNNKHVIVNETMYKINKNGNLSRCVNNRISKILNHDLIYDIKVLNMNNDNYDDVIVLCKNGLFYYKNTLNNGYDIYPLFIKNYEINNTHRINISEIKTNNESNKIKTSDEINKIKKYIEIKNTNIINNLNYLYLESSLDNLFRRLQKFERIYGNDKNQNDELFISGSKCKTESHFCKYYVKSEGLGVTVESIILNSYNGKHYNVNYLNNDIKNSVSYEEMVDNIKLDRKIDKVCNNLNEEISDSDLNKFVGVVPINSSEYDNFIHIKIPNNLIMLNSKITLYTLDNKKIILENNSDIISVNIGSARVGKCITINDLYGNVKTIVKPRYNNMYVF